MKKISRRQFLRISAVVGAGAVLASCKTPMPDATAVVTDEPVAEATATPKPIPPTATPKAQPSPTPVVEKVWPRENVARNRTMQLVSGEHPVGIGNPYAAGYTHQRGGAAQMEAMFYFAALADKTYSWLAESYEYNNDATECTIFLRKGVMWNDGTPFTAKDVAFTYNMLIEFAPLLRDSASVKSAVKGVEAVDDYTVKFTMAETNYRFQFFFCTYRMDRGIYLVPEHIFSAFKTGEELQQFLQWDPDNGVYPVHTGPYLLVRTEEQFTEFHLRYEWWAVDVGLADRMPWPEALTDIPRPADDVAAQLVINNEVDATMGLSPQLIPTIIEQASDHVVFHTGLEKPYGYVDWWPVSMYFNTLEAPYDDVRVRWAMAYAIDQEKLVEIAWTGAGTVTYTPFPNYPGLTKYFDGAKAIFDEYNVLEQDLDKVDALMTDAGFAKNADGFWAKDGETFDCDIWGNVPIFADLAPITAEMLILAGFPAAHVSPPDVGTGISDGRALLHFFGHGGSVADPYTTLQMYHSQWQKPTGENCGQNRPRWANSEYDAFVDEMSRTSPDDTAKMQDLFNKSMEIWYRELPEVPLVQWFHRLAMNTTYWTGWPNADNPYNTAYWHLTFPITLWNIEPTT